MLISFWFDRNFRDYIFAEINENLANFFFFKWIANFIQLKITWDIFRINSKIDTLHAEYQNFWFSCQKCRSGCVQFIWNATHW